MSRGVRVNPTPHFAKASLGHKGHSVSAPKNVTSKKYYITKIASLYSRYIFASSAFFFDQVTFWSSFGFWPSDAFAMWRFCAKWRFFGKITHWKSDSIFAAKMEWSLWRSDALAMRGFGNVQCQSDASVAKWRVLINFISANYFAQNEKINAYENYSWTNNINYLNLFIIIYFFN